MGKEVNFVHAYGWLSIATLEDYVLGACLYDEVDRPYADVPICSFEDAKKAIEEEIMAGHLRTITSYKLCYIPYFDGENKDILWLFPAWVVEGGYTRSAKKEFTPNYDEDGLLVDDGVEHYCVVYNANRGELLDYNDNSKNRRKAPAIKTWEMVQ